jgi:septal ring factor EnvC (AmiA/AmiB activator)
VSESQQAEVQLWQARCDDQSVAIERIREERDELKIQLESLQLAHETNAKELAIYRSMVERMRIAMSQGVEL